VNAQSKDTRNATSISRETCEYAFVICPSVFGFSPSDSALDSLVSLVSAMQGGVTALFSGCTNGYKAYCSHWQMFNTVLVQECDGKTKIALTGRTHEPCYLMTLYRTCPLPRVFTGARCLLGSIGLCVVSCFNGANLSPALHPCTELPIYSAEMCFSSRTSNAAKKKVLAETLPKLFAQREDRAVNEARAGELPAVPGYLDHTSRCAYLPKYVP
jgi:hypothetical protein